MPRIAAAQTDPKALPDVLNYAVVLESGVVLCKDGTLLGGLKFCGQDNDTLTASELNQISGQMNDRLRRLGEGWTLHVNAIRQAVAQYPPASEQHFPDKITALIDEERRVRFESGGAHYETSYYIVLSYLPPLVAQSKLEQLVYTDKGGAGSIADKVLSSFIDTCLSFADDLSQVAHVEILAKYSATSNQTEVVRDGLIDHLHHCISGLNHPINLPDSVIFLDSLLGRHDFVSGLEPMLDNQHLRIIAFDGYPAITFPGILRALDSLPLEYRWSSRFIYLDTEQAKQELNKFRRRWKQKQRGFADQFFGTQKSAIDQDAVSMVGETEDALAAASSETVTFGYFSSVIVLQETNAEALDDKLKFVMNRIRSHGCGVRLETVNSVDAWLGSLPGHNYANIRRPLIHTMNLVDLLPLSSLWPGKKHNPCNLYPPQSPALVYADTTGASIFRLNLHVGDVGHTLILGPTGAGKSTLLALLAAQFRRYSGAQVFAFDKGASMYCLTEAVGGDHYDIAAEDHDSVVFSPLQELETQDDRVWAGDWVKSGCELQLDRPLTPKEKALVHEMIEHLAAEAPEHRSLSAARNQLQDQTLREALANYTLEGNMGHLLDGEADGLSLSSWACFELETLMNYDDKDKLPVLMYLFRRIEKALTGAPALILIDEAWIMLGHSIFKSKIVEWLKVMRKNNAAVVLATQSLSDATRSGILDVILESTSTRIFLPNPAASSEVSRAAYEVIGLNRAEIDLIASATPKRQYYISSSEGNRLFDLKLDAIALAFLAQSGVASKKAVSECIKTSGESWQNRWLAQHGLSETAQQLATDIHQNTQK